MSLHWNTTANRVSVVVEQSMGNPEIAVATPNHGDEKPSEQVSLEALFDALETPLLVYAEKFTNDSDLAQDVVQEAFMKLHIQFDAVRQPRPWLYRTVHNLALNHWRASQKIVSALRVLEWVNWGHF
ncbi:MAG: RNA polymerase sigma factor, partial [Verrucomicrobia bacterium]|nr:RNA polymerase sigma factor [Verrucomicrobiota bacterium]